MRVYRRIAGCPRYGSGGPTDADVQQRLGIMPTDIWLLRKRLLALQKKLSSSAPLALQALCSQRHTAASAQTAADLDFAWWAFPELWWM